MGRRTIEPLDYIGKRYGYWLVKEYKGMDKHRHHTYLCQCDCGAEKVVALGNLKTGKSTNCGCVKIANLKGNDYNKKHGMSFSREYRSWESMLNRCEKPNDREYPMWGGRGIKVCERWHDFNNFYADMGKRPPNTTLDRIDNNGNYEPTNCRWANAKTQANNKRSNTLITYEGRTQTLQQWADEVGIGANTIHNRISNLGWSIEEAMTRKPSHASRKYDKVVS
jgi:hypothetical protein